MKTGFKGDIEKGMEGEIREAATKFDNPTSGTGNSQITFDSVAHRYALLPSCHILILLRL